MKTSVIVRCVLVFNFWERASEACSFSQYWKRGRFGSLSSTNATWVGYTSSEPRALRSRGIPFVQSTAPHVGLCCAGGRQIAWLRTRGCIEKVRTETYIVYVRISCICQILSYVSVLVPSKDGRKICEYERSRTLRIHSYSNYLRDGLRLVLWYVILQIYVSPDLRISRLSACPMMRKFLTFSIGNLEFFSSYYDTKNSRFKKQGEKRYRERASHSSTSTST
jgi:hypothetical protein